MLCKKYWFIIHSSLHALTCVLYSLKNWVFRVEKIKEKAVRMYDWFLVEYTISRQKTGESLTHAGKSFWNDPTCYSHHPFLPLSNLPRFLLPSLHCSLSLLVDLVCLKLSNSRSLDRSVTYAFNPPPPPLSQCAILSFLAEVHLPCDSHPPLSLPSKELPSSNGS